MTIVDKSRHGQIDGHTLPTMPCIPIVADRNPRAAIPLGEAQDGSPRLLQMR